MAKISQQNNRPERSERTFRVITNRRPVWGNVLQEPGAIISGRKDDPAIIAMYQRGWLEEVK